MLERLNDLVTFLTALGAGMMAGLFFAFSFFIMTAFSRLPPAGGIAAMNSINVAILNPWFFALFFGTALGSLALALSAVFNWSAPGAAWRLIGAALYLVGCILVTMVFNVPLNDRLAAVTPESVEGAAVWSEYLSTWTAWNHVRTATCLLSAAALTLALRCSAEGG